jgi:hypothetical protein
MGHPFLGYSSDVDDAGLRFLPGFFGLAFFPGFFFGLVLGLQGFGFAEEDFAEAGWASLLFDLFRVGALFGWADEGAVFVFVDFADHDGGVLQTHVSCAFGSANMGHPAVVVLGGDLKSVDEDPGAARVDAVGGQGQDYVGDGELDGVGVFERGQGVGRVLRWDVGLVGCVLMCRSLAGVAVEVAEVLVRQRG